MKVLTTNFCVLIKVIKEILVSTFNLVNIKRVHKYTHFQYNKTFRWFETNYQLIMTALTNIGVLTGRILDSHFGGKFVVKILLNFLTKLFNKPLPPPPPSQMKVVSYNDAQNPLEQITTQVSVNLVTDSSNKKNSLCKARHCQVHSKNNYTSFQE